MIDRNKQQSFTLIELLVVIVIIGILAGVIMISTSSSIDKANITKIKAFSETTKNGLLLNLISEWNFENISETIDQALPAGAPVNDFWGTNHGTANNGPILKNGNNCVEGQCLQFTGTQFVSMPSSHSFNITDGATLEAWVYFDQYSNTGTSTLLGSSFSYFWQYAYNGSPSCFVWEMYYDVARRNFDVLLSLIPLKKWTFLTLMYKEGDSIIYRDGVYHSLKSVGIINIPQTGSVFRIGNVNFYGSIDGVRYYNAALTYSHIKQNYIAGLDSLLSKNLISKEEYNQNLSKLSLK